MRFLLDTNVVIPLEDSSSVLDESLRELVCLASQHGHTLLVHPSSHDDINRDLDESRRVISLSRIRKYPALDYPPIPTDDDLTNLGLSKPSENDRIDNEIIFSLYKDAADLLVTEDRGIHKKAAALGLTSRVHYIQQATAFLKLLHADVQISQPEILDV